MLLPTARRAPVALALLGLGGCLQSVTTGAGISDSPGHTCATCKSTSGTHAATGAGAGGSSGGAGTTGGGSSGGGASSGSGGGSSGGTAADAGLLQCPAGTLRATTTVGTITGLTLVGSPVAGAEVNELGPDLVQLSGFGTSATSDANGDVQLCMTYGTPITLSITEAQTAATYMEELVVSPAQSDAGLPSLLSTGLLLLPYNVLGELLSVLPGGVQTAGAFVVVSINSSQGACPKEIGWSFGLLLPDGGTLPDGGNAVPFTAAYFDSKGVPALGLSATSESGTAILFGIDPSVGNLAILTATNPDAGACPLVGGEVQPTGRVALEDQSVTYAPLFTP